MAYYDSQIITFENQVEEGAFRQAWILWEKTSGSLRHRRVKVLVSFLLIALLILFMPWYTARYATAFVPVCAVALLVGYLIFQLILKVRMVEDEADRIFGSNRLLGQPEEVVITRDGYKINSAFETLEGYWAEAAQCLEAEDFFAITGGMERPLFILCKKNIPGDKQEEFSGKLKSIFAARYQRMIR